jgi:hypothetical protein
VNRVRLCCVVSLAGLLASSCLVLDRAGSLEPGSIGGVAVDEGGKPLRARIEIDGTAVVARADIDGAFLLRGLPAATHVLRLTQDDNGDGVAERAALTPVLLARFGDGVGTAVLGPVQLKGPHRSAAASSTMAPR